jgi:cyclopropane-fatty-acyl-phospholipid synthase
MTIQRSVEPEYRVLRQRSRRSGLMGLLANRLVPPVNVGRLRITLPNGEIIERCSDHPGPSAVMSLRRWRGLWRIFSEGEDGFANGYIDGDWSTPDLFQLLDLGIRNETAAKPPTKDRLFSVARNKIRHSLRANTRPGSRRNIAAHYDLGNEFFDAWLDRGMSYSSAIYRGEESLEQAQLQKLDRIAELLELRSGENILEVGCGWGALAERLVRHFGSTVTGITLSSEQLNYARTRLAKDINAGRADIRLLDYRDIHGRFDRVVSIEMIEAVGERYWRAYFAKLRASLHEGGVAVLQAITIAEHRFSAYRTRPDFVQRDIFPGGMLPTHSIIEREALHAGLKVIHREQFGDSYAKTLSAWRERFLRSWPNLQKLGFDERFRRLWEYYLTYCEVGFRAEAIDVGLFKLVVNA